MAINVIEWENLNEAERLALVTAGQSSPLAFTALWFNLLTADSFIANWHHHYFDWAARKLLAGEVSNLVVNIPPGGTKTEFFSVHLPVYCMTRFPKIRILNTCYSKDLVRENSTRSRDIVKSAEFQAYFPWQVGKDQVDDWTVEKDGKRIHQLYGRPSGGQITGVRGGYMSPGFTGYVMADDWDKIDDLFSEVKRKKAHTRLVNTLRSRRAKSSTPFIFVQQRGHVDDSTAFLLKGGMGVEVDLHITIPATIDAGYIASLPAEIVDRCVRDVCGSKQIDGEWSYWPAKESIDDLKALEKSHPYTFMSQYKQRPEALSGGIFRAEDFRTYGDVDDGADMPEPPGYEYRFITVDTAQKTNEWNDWTVFAEWGVYQGRLYRLSFHRERMEAPELRKTFEAFVKVAHGRNTKEHGTLRGAWVEDKSSGTGLIQEVRLLLPVPIHPVPREKDKVTRAIDVQGYVRDNRIVLPYRDPDNIEFVAEVASFSHDDSHKHDDQTDVMMDAIDVAFVTPSFGGAAIVTRSKHKVNR